MNSLSQELEFQDFYNDFARKNGLNRNPDDPRHGYNYRKAYGSYGDIGLRKILEETGIGRPNLSNLEMREKF